MSSKMAVFKVLKEHKERLESSLEQTDLVKVSLKLVECKIISKDVKEKLISLDHDHLDPDRKVRYLLQEVCESVKKDNKVFDRLVKVLTRLGEGLKDVCEAMRKELDKTVGGKISSEAESDVSLTERDVIDLVNLIVSGSHRWEEIGVALGLPEYVMHLSIACPTTPLTG